MQYSEYLLPGVVSGNGIGYVSGNNWGYQVTVTEDADTYYYMLTTWREKRTSIVEHVLLVATFSIQVAVRAWPA